MPGICTWNWEHILAICFAGGADVHMCLLYLFSSTIVAIVGIAFSGESRLCGWSGLYLFRRQLSRQTFKHNTFDSPPKNLSIRRSPLTFSPFLHDGGGGSGRPPSLPSSQFNPRYAPPPPLPSIIFKYIPIYVTPGTPSRFHLFASCVPLPFAP